MSQASPQPARPSVKDEATLLDVSEADSEQKTSTLERLNSDSWTWEILAIAFSLACSIALIVLLRQYDSAPVPQFRHGITLNAMISILATAAKGSFLLPVAEALSQHKWLWYRRSGRKLADFDTFDSASRGPWGSLIMLGRINFRDVASIGALITVLAIAFDPFMQQVVAYLPRSIRAADTFVNRTQFYQDPDIANFPDASVKSTAAIYNGIFNGDSVRDFAPFCPTGNCTWPPVTSLAFCSACEDLDLATVLACNVSKYYDPSDGGYHIETKTCTFGYYTNLFGGLQLSYSCYSSTYNFSVVSPIDLYMKTLNYTLAGLRNPWGGFLRLIMNANISVYEVNVEPMFIEKITLCALVPCLKTYNVSVYNGKPISTVISTWNYDGWKDEQCPSNAACGTFFPRPPVELVKGSSYTTFGFDSLTADLLSQSFHQVFNGYVDDSLGSSSSVIAVLYQTDDLGPMMENLATSLSAYMRSVSSEEIQGTAWTTETYVHVRWIWLILPMGMMPASLLFLASAIWRSWNVGVWKSSSLALLFHGLEDGSGNLNRQSKMQKVADRIVVRLQPIKDDTEKLVGPAVFKDEGTKSPREDVASPREDPASPREDSPVVFQIPRRPMGSRQSLGNTNEGD